MRAFPIEPEAHAEITSGTAKLYARQLIVRCAVGCVLLQAWLPAVAFPTVSFVHLVANGANPVYVQSASPEETCSRYILHTAVTYGQAIRNGHYAGPKVFGVDYQVPGLTSFACSYEFVPTDPPPSIPPPQVPPPIPVFGGLAVCGPAGTTGHWNTHVNSWNWTCVCARGTVFLEDTQECTVQDTIEPATDAGRSVGPSCDLHCGEPIHPGSGNMWHVESDYQGASGSLGLTRTYNSLPEFLDADISRLFGARWTHPYDAVLIAEKTLPAGKQPGQCWQRSDTLTLWCASPPAAASAVPQTVSIQRGDGKRFYFNKSNQAHVSVSGEPDRLQPSYAPDGSIGSWTLTTADDIRETFDAGGRLLSVTARNGTVQRMTYSDGKNNESRLGRLPANAPACGTVLAGRAPALGKLLCVTDHYGRQLHFGYDTYGRVKLALSPGGEITAYEYDGPSGGCTIAGDFSNQACSANNLTKVTYPDGKSRTYYYNELSHISEGKCPTSGNVAVGFGHLLNALTGLQDENGVRHINWTYGCDGKATSSELAGGIERVSLTYTKVGTDAPATVVRHTVGEP